MSKLDSYSMMIVSKYFVTLEDFCNIEAVNSKFDSLLSKFHYNPISITRNQLHLFPNLETLHIYSFYSDQFSDINFYRRVYWRPVSYRIYLQPHDNVIYKNVVYTLGDIELYGTDIPKVVTSLGDNCFIHNSSNLWFNANDNQNTPETIEVPPQITALGNSCYANNNTAKYIFGNKLISIGEMCFYDNTNLVEIVLPDSLRTIQNRAFNRCINLNNIAIPSRVEVLGECVFLGCSNLSVMNS
ncbi:hypothetical protein EIN_122580, partial [Entamoeba invadens IP1]